MESKAHMCSVAYHRLFHAYCGDTVPDEDQFVEFERSMGLRYLNNHDVQLSGYLVFEIVDPKLYLMAKMRYGI